MMTLAEVEERARVARIIAEDAETDAAGLDDQPFSGAVVARELGNHLAMIHRLALMVADLYEERADEVRALIATTHPEPPADVVERP